LESISNIPYLNTSATAVRSFRQLFIFVTSYYGNSMNPWITMLKVFTLMGPGHITKVKVRVKGS